jgi:hypothetical protein
MALLLAKVVCTALEETVYSLFVTESVKHKNLDKN